MNFLDCGGRKLDLSRPCVMGILNVTPDSFSDGGVFLSPQKAVAQALRMAEEGADIIDIGGESTRPYADPVPLEEELRRVLPVIETLAAETAVPISIDTYKARVAAEALRADGATVLFLAADGRAAGMIAVADPIKASSPAAL